MTMTIKVADDDGEVFAWIDIVPGGVVLDLASPGQPRDAADYRRLGEHLELAAALAWDQ